MNSVAHKKYPEPFQDKQNAMSQLDGPFAIIGVVAGIMATTSRVLIKGRRTHDIWICKKFMRSWLLVFLTVFISACNVPSSIADSASDAPEFSRLSPPNFIEVVSYQDALRTWRTPKDINAWIGAKFAYDAPRALALSETQRSGNNTISVYEPGEFFATPSGVCVDLSRFAVEMLYRIAPDMHPNYIMIEFTPVEIKENTLRLHWLASFCRDGNYYFFADSKRPGYIAGPYASITEFIVEYSQYRGRTIISFQEVASYQRKPRTIKLKQGRDEQP